MKRIYLEWKPVNISGGAYMHLYLVMREEPQDASEASSLSWRASGSVIRGGPNATLTKLLIETGALLASGDRYESVSDIGYRGIFDITDGLGASSTAARRAD